jgi:hypothetical protein
MEWTSAQILALAPDPASAKAGADLAQARRWVSLGRNEQAIWGECQGSGSTPYQTRIDPAEPAFKCSCPSRKFPCKHGLGLLLLSAQETQAFTQTSPPAWVTEWLTSRAERAQAKAEKQAAASTEPAQAVDLEAQARRAAQREERTRNGLADLATWLSDVVRRGLAAVRQEPASFWEQPAARLVDAQAPGVARRVRELGEVAASGDGWQARLLDRLGRLHLLLEAYRRLPDLPPAQQAEVRTRIGWPQDQDEVLARPGSHDRWLVASVRVDVEDRLRVRRTWLWGSAGNQAVLLLDFAHGSTPFSGTLGLGLALTGEVACFDGVAPLRGLLKSRRDDATLQTAPFGWAGIGEFLADYADRVAANPWLEVAPLALRRVTAQLDSGRLLLVDEAGQALPVATRCRTPWRILALAGGAPSGIFGEWDGDAIMPLSLWCGGQAWSLVEAGGETG